MRVPRAVPAVLLAAVLTLVACGREEEPVPPATEEPTAEGLSPEEIRMQVEPMSPEQAERLGIVDTTIHLEQLASPEDTLLTQDTLPPPNGAPPR
jgi:hypothetical protein